MAKHIAPCPFCGESHTHIGHNQLAFFVVCQHCQSSGPRRRQIDWAIHEWNLLSEAAQAGLQAGSQQTAKMEGDKQRIAELMARLQDLQAQMNQWIQRYQ